mmetsp:Transcript_4031/g.2985  ORF Transcript_4031/g.2985 Transcript_4031/m.2985 type:complete len:86 (+) Transcript_4031:260-517(+)
MTWNEDQSICELPEFKLGRPKRARKINKNKQYKPKGKKCGYVTFFEYDRKGKNDTALFTIWYDNPEAAFSLVGAIWAGTLATLIS